MENVFLNLGINGVVSFILFIFIKNGFKYLDSQTVSNKEIVYHERQNNKENIDNLCAKIDKLIETIHDEVTYNVQINANRVNDMDKIKDQYLRIANKVEEIRSDVKQIQERQLQIYDTVNYCKMKNGGVK